MERADRRLARLRGFDCIALTFQIDLERPPDLRFVVDDQNARSLPLGTFSTECGSDAAPSREGIDVVSGYRTRIVVSPPGTD